MDKVNYYPDTPKMPFKEERYPAVAFNHLTGKPYPETPVNHTVTNSGKK